MTAFRKRLLDWYRDVRRDLPWRRTSDPYRVWISEIMLQQTRVAAVIPYYEKFLGRFPDAASLASAPEADLLTHWAGLGYYTRARNLQKAAQQMADGMFPSTYEGIRALAGVGDYTAAAVASISFGLPHAAVDGNVLRVLTRLGNDSSDIALPATRKRLAAEAQRMLDPRHPGDYNQAVMELGATVCTPRNPACGECPVSRWCEARVAGTQQQLPVKIRAQKQEAIELRLLAVVREGRILLRPSEKVAGFWDLPQAADLPAAMPGPVLGSFTHQITFRKYSCVVVEASLKKASIPTGFRWFDASAPESMPVSTMTRKALAAASTR